MQIANRDGVAELVNSLHNFFGRGAKVVKSLLLVPNAIKKAIFDVHGFDN